MDGHEGSDGRKVTSKMSRPSRGAARANGRRCMLSAPVVVIRPGNEPSCICRSLCFSSKTMCGVKSAWGMQHSMVCVAEVHSNSAWHSVWYRSVLADCSIAQCVLLEFT
jgi:hypothetical protein